MQYRRYLFGLIIGLILSVSSIYPSTGTAANRAVPPKIAVLVRDLTALDVDENNLVSFLNQINQKYDLADAALIKNGTLNLDEYPVLYMRTGEIPTAYQDVGISAKIKERIRAGAHLVLEYYGVYLAEYLKLGQVTTTDINTSAYDAAYFIEPVAAENNYLPWLENITQWSPPVPPDQAQQLITQITESGTRVYPQLIFNTTPAAVEYWTLLTSYGATNQETDSSYCQDNPTLCNSERAVYKKTPVRTAQKTNSENGLEFVRLGKGKVISLGLDIGQTASARSIVFGPVATQMRTNIVRSLAGDQPDFVVTPLNIVPSSPITGSTFSVVAYIENIGAAAGDAGQLTVWANQPKVQNCSAVGDKSIAVGTIDAGGNTIVTIPGLSAGSAGNKTLRLFVESNCAINESGENNNQATKLYKVVDRPDLVVTNIILSPAAPITGEKFSALVTVTNRGAVIADGGGNLSLWIDQSTTPSCDATGDKVLPVAKLEAGASTVITFTNLPAGNPGAHTLRAFIDSNCAIPEINESNNQLTQSYNTIAPDFVVTNITLNPAIPALGENFQALITIKNQGTAAGNGGKLTVWANSALTPDCGAGGDQKAFFNLPLAVGESKTFTINELIVENAGSKNLLVFVDSECEAREINESNNQFTQSYSVGAPDFVITAATLNPTAPVLGDSFSAIVTVTNQGTSPGNAGQLAIWADRASANCGTAADKSMNVGTLAAGETKSFTLSGLTIDSSGRKNLLAFIDSACSANEINTANNQFTQVYRIHGADLNQPDLVITNLVIKPAAPLPNSAITVEVTVQNQGTAAGNGGFVDLWLNQPTIQNCGAEGDAWLDIGNLAVNEIKTLTFTLNSGAAGANRTLRAFVDSWCLMSETRKDNNQFTKSYSVSAPDFIVSAIMLLNPAASNVNSTFDAVVTVKNQGTGAGNGGKLSVWANQAAVQNCGAKADKSVNVGSLAAGVSKNLTVTGIAAGAAGNKTLRAFVDSACVVAEADEGNNQFSKNYTPTTLWSPSGLMTSGNATLIANTIANSSGNTLTLLLTNFNLIPATDLPAVTASLALELATNPNSAFGNAIAAGLGTTEVANNLVTSMMTSTNDATVINAAKFLHTHIGDANVEGYVLSKMGNNSASKNFNTLGFAELVANPNTNLARGMAEAISWYISGSDITSLEKNAFASLISPIMAGDGTVFNFSLFDDFLNVTTNSTAYTGASISDADGVSRPDAIIALRTRIKAIVDANNVQASGVGADYYQSFMTNRYNSMLDSNSAVVVR